jgi:hypothetical protein
LDLVFEKQELVDEFFRPFQPPGIIDLWPQPVRVFLNADEGRVDRTNHQLLRWLHESWQMEVIPGQKSASRTSPRSPFLDSLRLADNQGIGDDKPFLGTNHANLR